MPALPTGAIALGGLFFTAVSLRNIRFMDGASKVVFGGLMLLAGEFESKA